MALAPGLQIGWLEEALSTTKQETHQTVIFFIVDARFVGCVTNPLQERGLASIGSTDHENTEMTVFLSRFEGGLDVSHGGSR